MLRAKARLLFITAIVVGFGCVGPSPNGDDVDVCPPFCADNEYHVLVETSVTPATCGLTTAASLARFSTVLAGIGSYTAEMLFDDYVQVTYEIDGSALYDPTSPANVQLDFNATAVATTDYGFQTTLDCVLDAGVSRGGELLVGTTFMLNDVYRFDVITGTECDLVASSGGFLSLPCVDSENTTWEQ